MAVFERFSQVTGTDISTCPLAPARAFFEKGLLVKYILVFTCPNEQGDFLITKHISFIVKGPNTQTYANNATNPEIK